ncbi:hypothetical protein NKH82_33240 [Mesorhizobium sp. M0915]|uniref:hypothetical protein n=1 Tax=Mesorhizobium sp. M0915 TaxID=2957027 RepID=UPI00333A34D8
MSDAAVSPAVNEDEAPLATPFVRWLVRLIGAQDSYASWEGKSDAELLGDFIITRKNSAVRSPSSAIPIRTCCGGSIFLHGRRA